MVTNINWKIGRNIGCPFLDKFAKTAISFLLLGKMEECGKVEADPAFDMYQVFPSERS